MCVDEPQKAKQETEDATQCVGQKLSCLPEGFFFSLKSPGCCLCCGDMQFERKLRKFPFTGHLSTFLPGLVSFSRVHFEKKTFPIILRDSSNTEPKTENQSSGSGLR